MSAERVWMRFEKKRKDGSTWKLRIQDVPPDRLDEAIELRAKYFARDEVVHKATGITKNPEAVKGYKEYLNMTLRHPRSRTVICCDDSGDEVWDIIGTSSVTDESEEFNWEGLLDRTKENGTAEGKKLIEVFYSLHKMYNHKKETSLSSYLDDLAIQVLPRYRGYGISQEFLRTRRLMCEELNIPQTGGWMTGHATQKSASRDGWETVFEVKYEDLARTHDLVFEDAPPTMKYMVAGPIQET